MCQVINYVNVLKEHLFELAFAGIAIRTLIAGASFGEAVMFLGLIGSMTYYKHYLNKDKGTKYEASEKQIKDMETAINSMQFALGIKRSNEKK